MLSPDEDLKWAKIVVFFPDHPKWYKKSVIYTPKRGNNHLCSFNIDYPANPKDDKLSSHYKLLL